MDALARPKDDLFDNSTMTFGEHLEELRQALVRAILCLMVGLGIGLFFANRVIRYIQAPLKAAIVEFRAERDLTKLGWDKDDPVVKPWLSFLSEESLVAELVYDAPQALSNRQAASNPSSASAVSTEAAMGVDAPDSKEESATTLSGADALEQLLAAGEPTALQPRLQFRRSEQSVSSLKMEEPFMTWIKAGLIIGAVIASPGIFYYLWSFVAAGLHAHERKYVYVYLPISVILFVSGVVLAFGFVLQFVLQFLLSFNASMDVAADPRLSHYVNLVLLLPLGFGIAFQLPIIMLFLQRIGLVETKSYLESWRIAVVVIFVIAMIATPADVTSMVALAVPLMFLYFLGIGMCYLMPRGRGLGSGAYDPS
ncbi:MAG: twin-arginine translocase subunit TatC [Planctomycetota bacterium]